jgi:hypothetical protein
VFQHAVLRSVPVGFPASLLAGVSSHSGKAMHNVAVIMVIKTILQKILFLNGN